MNTLDYIVNKFKLDVSTPSPIEISNVGRNDLAGWFHDLDFKIGVEVGVNKGEYSEVLCKANPQMKIYGVDPYEFYKGYEDDCQTVEEFREAYQEAKDRLGRFPNYVFIKQFSMDALKRFEDNSLDFVYIDANHTNPYVTWDIKGWSKKVKSGGIISRHDYRVDSSWKVVEAVNKYIKNNQINPWFILGIINTLSGIFVDADTGNKSFWLRCKYPTNQVSNPVDDIAPSWMFIKQ